MAHTGVRMTSMKPLPALTREQVWTGPCGLSPSGVCQGWNRYLLKKPPSYRVNITDHSLWCPASLLQLQEDPKTNFRKFSCAPSLHIPIPGPGILSCHCDSPHPASSWSDPAPGFLTVLGGLPPPVPSPMLGDDLYLFLMAQSTARCCSWCCPKHLQPNRSHKSCFTEVLTVGEVSPCGASTRLV